MGAEDPESGEANWVHSLFRDAASEGVVTSTPTLGPPAPRPVVDAARWRSLDGLVDDRASGGVPLEALPDAVWSARPAEVQRLLGFGKIAGGAAVLQTALDFRDTYGRSLLHLCAETLTFEPVAGEACMVALLAAGAAEVNGQDRLGETPLLIAVRAVAMAAAMDPAGGEAAAGGKSSRLGPVRLLLQAGAEANLAVPESANETPLMQAACGGCEDLCELLLEFRADPGLRSDSGLSALDFLDAADDGAGAGDGAGRRLRALLSGEPVRDAPNLTGQPDSPEHTRDCSDEEGEDVRLAAGDQVADGGDIDLSAHIADYFADEADDEVDEASSLSPRAATAGAAHPEVFRLDSGDDEDDGDLERCDEAAGAQEEAAPGSAQRRMPEVFRLDADDIAATSSSPRPGLAVPPAAVVEELPSSAALLLDLDGADGMDGAADAGASPAAPGAPGPLARARAAPEEGAAGPLPVVPSLDDLLRELDEASDFEDEDEEQEDEEERGGGGGEAQDEGRDFDQRVAGAGGVGKDGEEEEEMEMDGDDDDAEAREAWGAEEAGEGESAAPEEAEVPSLAALLSQLDADRSPSSPSSPPSPPGPRRAQAGGAAGLSSEEASGREALEAALLEAVRAASPERARALLGALPEAPLAVEEASTEDGGGLLHACMDRAPSRAALEVSKILLEYRADVNRRNGAGETALLLAARGAFDRGPSTPGGAEELLGPLAVLLEARANPNICDFLGESALLEAAFEGCVEVCSILLAARADPSHRSSYCNSTALELAQQEGHWEAIELLRAKVDQPRAAAGSGAVGEGGVAAAAAEAFEAVRGVDGSGAGAARGPEPPGAARAAAAAGAEPAPPVSAARPAPAATAGAAGAAGAPAPAPAPAARAPAGARAGAAGTEAGASAATAAAAASPAASAALDPGASCADPEATSRASSSTPASTGLSTAASAADAQPDVVFAGVPGAPLGPAFLTAPASRSGLSPASISPDEALPGVVRASPPRDDRTVEGAGPEAARRSEGVPPAGALPEAAADEGAVTSDGAAQRAHAVASESPLGRHVESTALGPEAGRGADTGGPQPDAGQAEASRPNEGADTSGTRSSASALSPPQPQHEAGLGGASQRGGRAGARSQAEADDDDDDEPSRLERAAEAAKRHACFDFEALDGDADVQAGGPDGAADCQPEPEAGGQARPPPAGAPRVTGGAWSGTSVESSMAGGSQDLGTLKQLCELAGLRVEWCGDAAQLRELQQFLPTHMKLAVRELKRRCAESGIALEGAFDKEEIVVRLRQAALWRMMPPTALQAEARRLGAPGGALGPAPDLADGLVAHAYGPRPSAARGRAPAASSSLVARDGAPVPRVEIPGAAGRTQQAPPPSSSARPGAAASKANSSPLSAKPQASGASRGGAAGWGGGSSPPAKAARRAEEGRPGGAEPRVNYGRPRQEPGGPHPQGARPRAQPKAQPQQQRQPEQRRRPVRPSPRTQQRYVGFDSDEGDGSSKRANLGPRVRHHSDKFPAYDGEMPPPEAEELWTDKELHDFFYSSGFIYPKKKVKAEKVITPAMLHEAYRALGLPPNVKAAEVKKHYRAMALKYHPDKNSNSQESTSKFQELTEAYTLLCQHFESRRKGVAPGRGQL